MHKLVTVVVFLLLVSLVAASGAMFQPGSWYAGLDKPSWTPPNVVFPVAWGILYICIALAGAHAWLAAAPGRRLTPFLVYGLQLAANAAWSWLFFGLHLTLVGLVDVIVLLILILVNIVLFWRIDRLAGGLLIPYGLWVFYATTLNLGIVVLNR